MWANSWRVVARRAPVSLSVGSGTRVECAVGGNGVRGRHRGRGARVKPAFRLEAPPRPPPCRDNPADGRLLSVSDNSGAYRRMGGRRQPGRRGPERAAWTACCPRRVQLLAASWTAIGQHHWLQRAPLGPLQHASYEADGKRVVRRRARRGSLYLLLWLRLWPLGPLGQPLGQVPHTSRIGGPHSSYIDVPHTSCIELFIHSLYTLRWLRCGRWPGSPGEAPLPANCE